MKLFYYKGKISNFGDDINPWLWNRLIPEVISDESDGHLLLGIGSILYDRFPQDQIKVVLGSGYGGYTGKPVIDHRWNFYFVRGPRTAAALGLDRSLAITDAAILLRTQVELLAPATKRHAVSFMPHFESASTGGWSKVCEEAGVHYIDPRGDPVAILDELRASERLVTEAMHGAIIADALRVPWIPILPSNTTHRFKWLDWCDSVEVSYAPSELGTSSTIETMHSRGLISYHPGGRLKAGIKVAAVGADYLFRKRAVRRLKQVSGLDPVLSRDSVIEARTLAAVEKLEQLKADYARTQRG